MMYYEGGCARIPNTILTFGPEMARIRIGKRTYFFEWHHYFGPSLLRADGSVCKTPKEHHPFWDAIHRWYHQGQRMQNGYAVWDA
jgi:hypothetical protein